jgi:hypothetical protein
MLQAFPTFLMSICKVFLRRIFLSINNTNQLIASSLLRIRRHAA